ncbi:DUF2934 domain-containing protein [Caballeronia humi]|uniref:DUF2934 domain-containing protein n=1 Tax=Caballeronia humi TaxID=326474 RepID=A0A158IU91_9BURK|nr:DUF2934 domain-containing protein [Caballeronia humi]SAL60136.1 hypothetical protein AWB65_05415 [Caballeronia humi]
MPLETPEEHIQLHAYRLWEADGRPHGRDEYYWHQACAQLQTDVAPPSGLSSDEGTKPTDRKVTTKKTATTSNAEKASKPKNKNVSVASGAERTSKTKGKVSGKTGADIPDTKEAVPKSAKKSTQKS